MTTPLRLLSVVTVLLCTLVASWSYPTLFGDTGLVLTPSADVMPTAQFDFAVNYTKVGEGDGKATVFPLRLTYGLTSMSEFFLVYSAANSGAQGFDVIGGGIKMGILREDLYRNVPGVALGARAYSVKDDGSTNVVDGYLVVSKSLITRGDLIEDGFNIRLHGGVSYMNYSGDISESFISPFAGLSLKTAGGSAFVVDYIAEQEIQGTTLREATVSAAFRRPLSDHFFLELASTRPFGIRSGDTYSIGLLYHYGEISRTEKRYPVLF